MNIDYERNSENPIFPIGLATARASYKEPGEHNYKLPTRERMEEIDRGITKTLENPEFWEEVHEEIRRAS